MRFFKASLRTLIMLVSTFSFLGGWVLLAHSLKPVSNSSSSAAYMTSGIAATPLPTLAPLPGLDFSQSAAQPVQQQNPFTIVQQAPQPQPQVQSMPMFTTSGS
ncbi:MAG TPA: hypothetical protein VIN60_07370 [Anaerolineales bacterium]